MLVTDERAGDTLHRFVGRRRELEALRTALADARGGCGGLVLVTGEAGIGKTRLVEEFACEVAAGCALVVWGRCREAAGASSYSPWVQLLRGWRAEAAEVFDAALGARASYVAQLLPELRAERPALPAPPISPDAEHGRFYLFEALAAFVRAGARQRPLVLVLDDVQWGDPDSLLLLEHVAARTREAATLLLATCRDPEGRPTPRVARLAGALSRIGRHLPLRGLDVDDVRRLLALHMPGGSVTGVLARLIHRRTEGNPFFVDETARVLAAEGGFARPELAADGMLPLPGGVREVLRRRLSPLPAPCVRALEVAAVMGREFDTVSLGRACGVAPEAVLEAIGPAAASGLVVRDGTTPGRFRFAHELIRETLYEELPAAERARLHGRVGEILETMHGARLEAQLATLAHHFLASAMGTPRACSVSRSSRSSSRMVPASSADATTASASIRRPPRRAGRLGRRGASACRPSQCAAQPRRFAHLSRRSPRWTARSVGHRAAPADAEVLAPALQAHVFRAHVAVVAFGVFVTPGRSGGAFGRAQGIERRTRLVLGARIAGAGAGDRIEAAALRVDDTCPGRRADRGSERKRPDRRPERCDPHGHLLADHWLDVAAEPVLADLKACLQSARLCRTFARRCRGGWRWTRADAGVTEGASA